MNYIDHEKKPFPFCPGCSHHVVVDAIGNALEKIQIDPKKVVLVSDIGCMGIVDRYFNIHTLHGLHGRSFTYACGIKLANPELTVFVMVGDGGCGIGGHHLINAARRNIGIKVVCFNNFNFGMTGGEHSVTTPIAGITNSTLSGSIEPPFDLCNLVLASNGSFVARKTAFDTDLSDVISEAFKHDGFSFVDILEICTAYYMPLNDFKKTNLMQMIENMKLSMGILRNNDIPEFSKKIRSTWPSKKQEQQAPQIIKKRFSSQLNEEYSVMIAGSAGQKIVSAASNLAKAGIASGLYASQQNDYPVTVQTGHSLSEIKLSKKRTFYPNTEHLDALIILSDDGLKVAKKHISKLSSESTLIISDKLEAIKTKAKIYQVNFSNTKLSITNLNIATTAISFLININKIIPAEAFKFILESISKEKIRDINIKAYEAGISLYSMCDGR
ncbi:MAG: hypothetical protein COS89_02290 [Deltaproteobacteria bacterium CG07_land_8_20_14_0_80_38_7]|nr:MAG: hypothetical protein COS89_02290 [Deltaproteobacteria bacterium CG07_land_8_20_14_0_80_38_7]